MSFGYQVLGFGGGEEIVPEFMEATGGSVTTSGDYKIHVFQADGTFSVTVGYDPTYGTEAHYLVVAGAGNSSSAHDGGGGGGGFRTSYPGDPLAAPAGLTLSKGGYPITVGAGGAVGPGQYAGGDSIFSTITSTGGGFGYSDPGGSGGGGAHQSTPAGAGNTPPTTPSQGNPGGTGHPNPPHGSGGGGGGVGTGGPNHGTGGAGAPTSIHPGYPLGTLFSGGGGGGGTGGAGAGGPGGGGAGVEGGPGVNGTDYLGGGGGAGAGSGGDGVVMIRYKFQ